MTPDLDTVTKIIRDVADREIMPRFRRLGDGDVREKAPGDLVTVADTRAEERLAEALADLVPGSRVVGEEAADADPGVFQALGDGGPVWLVDPVDGTHNFAHGKPCFAVIIAFCLGGRIDAGWIHDPVAGHTAWAAAGQGAWLDGRPLRLEKPRPLGNMKGFLRPSLRKRLERPRLEGVPEGLHRYRCTGREYMDLALGAVDFCQYTRLKPWDHAAGVLIHAECGGFGALSPGREPYLPGPGVMDATILLAPDEASWEALAAVLEI